MTHSLSDLPPPTDGSRNERFPQGGPGGSRGMGAGNPGFGRVREEYEGSAKKPRF